MSAPSPLFTFLSSSTATTTAPSPTFSFLRGADFRPTAGTLFFFEAPPPPGTDPNVGPIVQEEVSIVPGTSYGQLSDAFTGIPNNSRFGPAFEHIVLTVGQDVHGPLMETPATPTLLDKIGPVLDHTVVGIPAHISLGDPDPDVTETDRNTIIPDLVDFKSPGVYGLEKDLEGNLSGFKY